MTINKIITIIAIITIITITRVIPIVIESLGTEYLALIRVM